MSETNIPKHVVFVSAYARKGDKFLIARRSSNDPQAGGLWAVPGGKVEVETMGDGVIEETLAREILEETGVIVDPNTIKYLASQGFNRVSGDHVVGLTFQVDYASGEAEPLEDQEEVKWVTKDELLSMIEADPRLKYMLVAAAKLES